MKTALAKLGMTQTELGARCGVSKEAASNWIAGESVPRPGKLKLLAEALGLDIEALVLNDTTIEPVVAFRTRDRKPVTGAAKDAGLEIGRHLQQLLPYTGGSCLFSPKRLKAPSLDLDAIKIVTTAVRAEMGLGSADKLSSQHILDRLHEVDAVLVPVFWGGDREGHENALSVYLPESQTSWVYFNLGCRQDDFNYWLAHELGHCLTLHALRDDDGEKFAEMFAQQLLFPDELAEQCLAKMRTTTDRLAVANWFAGQHEISVVTVVRAVQRVAAARGEAFEKLDTEEFFLQWRADRDATPSVVNKYFGIEQPGPMEYVVRSEEVFRTPIFRALSDFQCKEGRRMPAFVAATLNVSIGDAIALADTLWERVHCTAGAASPKS